MRLERGPIRESKESKEKGIEEKEIKKIVDKIEEIYDKNKEEIDAKAEWRNLPNFTKEKNLRFPEIQPELLEKVLNGFIKRYEEKGYSPGNLGLLLSYLTNRTVEKYIQAEKKKGKKLEDIEPLKLTLDIQNLLESPYGLVFENQEKCALTFIGDCDICLGEEMEGGKIFFEGGVRTEEIHPSAFSENISENNRGKIWVRLERIWPIIIPLDESRRR